MVLALRDRIFLPWTVVYVVGPVAGPVLDAIEGAAATLHRTRWRRVRTARVLRAEASLDGAALVAHAAGALRHHRDVAVVVAGERVALALNHALADGAESSAMLHALLVQASGGLPEPQARTVRLPLLRAIAATGPSGFRRYAASRGGRPVPAGAPVPDGGRPALAGTVLSADQVSALRRLPSGDGRATLSTRIGSVALAVLRDGRLRPGPVCVLVGLDLRHGLAGRVVGNLVLAEPLGLLDEDWTPATLGARLAERRATAVPALCRVILRDMLTVNRLRGTGAGAVVSVALMQSPELPDVAPAGRSLAVACAVLGPGPQTFAFALQEGGRVHLSLWDDTGFFDPADFTARFTALLGGRATV